MNKAIFYYCTKQEQQVNEEKKNLRQSSDNKKKVKRQGFHGTRKLFQKVFNECKRKLIWL